jgi:hypothetical protein
VLTLEKTPVQFWYHALWKQKSPYNLYEVHNPFLSTFNNIDYVPNTSIFFIEATSFFKGKRAFENLDDLSFIRFFGFGEKPSLLPFCVLDKFFAIEVCKQYNFWPHLFNEKTKNSSFIFLGKLGKSC